MLRTTTWPRRSEGLDISFNEVTGCYVVGIWDEYLLRRVTIEIERGAWGRLTPEPSAVVEHARAVHVARKRNSLFKPGRHEAYNFKGKA